MHKDDISISDDISRLLLYHPIRIENPCSVVLIHSLTEDRLCLKEERGGEGEGRGMAWVLRKCK